MTQTSPNDNAEFQRAECRRLITNHCDQFAKQIGSARRRSAASKALATKKQTTKAPPSKKKNAKAPAKKASSSSKTKNPPRSSSSKKTGRISSDSQFEVARILDSRGRGTKREFLVEWRGFTAEESTWEPSSNILDPSLIDAYENIRSSKRIKKASK